MAASAADYAPAVTAVAIAVAADDLFQDMQDRHDRIHASNAPHVMGAPHGHVIGKRENLLSTLFYIGDLDCGRVPFPGAEVQGGWVLASRPSTLFLSSMADDPFNLQRFVTAQLLVYDTALGELTAGRKRSHWMWWIFPQLRGLGHSPRAYAYGLSGLAEARAYLAHPVLGPRLADCTRAVLSHPEVSLTAMFGSPDDLKFRSSMTLFAEAGGGNLYQTATNQACDGRADAATLRLLAAP